MSTASIRLMVEARLEAGAAVTVTDTQAHYLANVMRAVPGDNLRLFNGADGEWQARIETVSRKAVTLTPTHQTRAQEPPPDIILCFALLKRQKTDLVVEKATELGVSAIRPVITARTQADHVNLARLRAIATEAAEQCEGLSAPSIAEPVPLAALLQSWPPRPLYVADERRTAPHLRPAPGPAGLLIGPEGGFSDAEIEMIGRHDQVRRISLGARILRAETAAIAALSLFITPAI
jgi:16S rRNA (uracil1498-N3)-methyltransferase